MPFNSLNFGIFFLVFYVIYLVIQRHHRIQNIWLLVGSYIFYAAWDWHFLLILIGITIIDYLIGRGLGWQENGWLSRPIIRRLLLWAGLLGNLGTLIYFKYAGFFKAGLMRLTNDMPVDTLLVDVLLPIGLSFYALQAMSYLFDVYRRRIQAERSLIELALFIGFFPQLLAGPIERAGRMLPQFHKPRQFTPEMVSAGIYLLLSGYFKKLVVADNLGLIVTQIFDNYSNYSGIDLVIGVLAFTGQLYADFSAYSDIARGIARLLGIELMVNFRLPYFAASPADFWSRWHISLSEWLRDYFFYPLRKIFLRSKSQAGLLAGLVIPPLLTMLVSGIWHGTGWNYLVWGLYHGILLILYQVIGKEKLAKPIDEREVRKNNPGQVINSWVWPRLETGIRILIMFGLVWIGWLIFRVDSTEQLVYFLTHFSLATSSASPDMWANLILYSLPLVGVQILQQARGDLSVLARFPLGLRIIVYGAALALIVILGVRQTSEFIYVQF